MTPMMSRSASRGTEAEVAQPMAMPASAPGSSIFRSVRSLWWRQVQSATPSITMRIGSRMAAACTGGTAMASSGTPMRASASPMPPFVSPTRRTAGMAA